MLRCNRSRRWTIYWSSSESWTIYRSVFNQNIKSFSVNVTKFVRSLILNLKDTKVKKLIKFGDQFMKKIVFFDLFAQGHRLLLKTFVMKKEFFIEQFLDFTHLSMSIFLHFIFLWMVPLLIINESLLSDLKVQHIYYQFRSLISFFVFFRSLRFSKKFILSLFFGNESTS